MSKRSHPHFTALGFLLPNLLGFAAFTLVPLVISLAMAFTDWDLAQHNMYTGKSVSFVGLENFRRLLGERDFYTYFGNTLFLMAGIPFGIAGSLGAALLLSGDFRGGSGRAWALTIAGAGLVAGAGALVLTGAGASAMTLLVCGLTGLILVGGSLGGSTVFRTLFYFPHFTAGVATFILWKKLSCAQACPRRREQ